MSKSKSSYSKKSSNYNSNEGAKETEIEKSLQDINSYLATLKPEKEPSKKSTKEESKHNESKAADVSQISDTNSYASKNRLKRAKTPDSNKTMSETSEKRAARSQSRKSVNDDASRFTSTSIGRGPSLRGKSKRKTIKKKPLREQYSLDEIKARLKKLFQLYTSYGDRTNSTNLKSTKMKKMIADANLKEMIPNETLDILFTGETKNKPNMDFDTFLGFLIKLGRIVYKDSKYSDADNLDYFIRDHLFPLYAKLTEKTETGFDEKLLQEALDEKVLLVLFTVNSMLIKMYKEYFAIESRTNDDSKFTKAHNEKCLFLFLKEFDICPALLTKSAVYTLWNDILDTPVDKLSKNSKNLSMTPFLEKDFGGVFSYSKFLALLSRVAIIAFDAQLGPKNRRLNPAEKLSLLLERMELSHGMLAFEKKLSLTHNSKVSLVLPKEVLEKVITTADNSQEIMAILTRKEKTVRNESPSFGGDGSKLIIDGIDTIPRTESKMDTRNKSFRSPKLDKKEDPEQLKSQRFQIEDLDVKNLIETHRDALFRIFRYYASFGEPLNYNSLKSIKFLKMLKEAGLVQSGGNQSVGDYSRILEKIQVHENELQKTLTQIDIDIIFVSLTGNKNIKDLNSNPGYKRNISTPMIGHTNYLHKNDANNQVNGKLDFDCFLKSIEIVSSKLIPEYSTLKAVKYVINRHFLKLDEQIKKITTEYKPSLGGAALVTLIDLLKNPEMVSFLGLIHKSMVNYFEFYADSNGYMNFEMYNRFCKDFGIFPDILSKGKMLNLFHTLSSVHKNAQKEIEQHEQSQAENGKKVSKEKKRAPEQTEDDLIDQHLFTEGIALCAFEVPHLDPQPSNLEKICFLLEKMNKSGGTDMVKKELGLTRPTTGGSWDILDGIRKKHPELFTSNKTPVYAGASGFDTLLGGK